MSSWWLIALSLGLTLAWIYGETSKSGGFPTRNPWLKRSGLAAIAFSLAAGLATSPLDWGWFHPVLPLLFGWLLLKCAQPNHRSDRKGRQRLSPQRRRLWLVLSFSSAIALLLLWQLQGISLSIQMGLTLPLFCVFCSGLMVPFIRLRAWVLASLIAFSSFGAIVLEATMSQPSQAQTVPANTETMIAGAYIIDMGQTAQSLGNGLKPYGLVYELVVKKAIPVKWAIDPSKAREGIDFTANGKSYRGGSFIIPAEYAADALSSIASWKAQGVVVDGPIGSSFNAPIFSTITNFPNAVLDFQNGSIAQAYYTNAGIPASSTGTFGTFNTYRFGYPSSLTPCDDLFVMPHADPTWANHQNLIPFVQSRGFVWAACHAVSVLERVDDPGDADTLPDMNFLSHVPPATQDSKSLKLFGAHAAPTAGPYQYGSTSNALPYGYGGSNLWAYPIMQFLGKIDLATQNGSEQIYIPDVGAQWRNETAIAAYDQSNTDAVVAGTATPPTSQQKAVKMAFGPAYGNANNGMVMYEAGHSHAKATGPDNIAAQRAFFNFVLLNGLVRGIKVDVNIPASITAGSTVNLATSHNGGPAATVVGGNGSFSYRWYSSCGGTFSNATVANPTFTAPTNAGTCTLRVVVNDGCNRRSFGADTAIIAPAPPAPKQVDLEVFKTDNQTTLVTGDPVTYTVTVKNNGPATISSFTLTDTATATSGGSAFTASPTITVDKGTYNSGTGLWSRATDLAVGEVLTFSVAATVNSAATGSLTNTATVTVPSGFIDTNSSNSSSTDTDTLQAKTIDISVVKNDGITTVYENQNTTYTITVTNNGNVTIPGLEIKDRVYRTNGTVTRPSNGAVNPSTLSSSGNDSVYGTIDRSVFNGNVLTVSNLSKAGSSFTGSSGTTVTQIALSDTTPTTYQWRAVNLAPGETVTLQLAGQNKAKTGEAYIANVISVQPLNASNTTTGFTDTNQSNNGYYDANLTLNKLADELDLRVTKTITTPTSPTLPNRGTAIAYTIDVENQDTGKSPAGVAFQDIIPNDITPTTWTCQVLDIGKVEANNKDAVTVTNRFTKCTVGTSSSTVAISASSSSNTAGNTIQGTINADPAPANRTLNGTLNLYKASNNSTPSKIRFTVTGTVKANALSGSVANTATLSSFNTANSWQDTNLANNTSTVSYTLSPLYRLSLSKTDGLAGVELEQTVTYTISVANNGPDTATAIKVVDDLAQGYLLNPVYSASAGTYNGATGDWTGLTLASGQTVTLTVSGKVANNTPTGTGTFKNTATLTVPTGVVLQNSSETVVTSLTAEDIDNVNPSADLAIAKTDNQTSAVPGGAISYTLTVKNNGPSPVSSVKITDTVPAQILNATVSGPDGVTLNTTSGYWEGLTLQAGDSAVFVLSGTVDPAATGTLTNTATVATPTGIVDPNSANNSSTDTDTLSPTADISISKSDGKSAVNPGDAIAYTVKVANNGPSVASNATLIDTVPNDITGVTWTCAVTTGNGACGAASGSGNAINTTVTLNNGATATYTIQGTVSPAAPNPGTLTNTASVSLPSGTTDPNLTNNSSTDRDTIPIPTGVVDLSIAKNDGLTQVMSGSPVTYSIEVTNNSPTVTVQGVKLIDILPPTSQLEEVFFSSPNGPYDAATGEWDVTLPPGAKALLLVDGAVPLTTSSGSLTNTATVYPPDGFTDPDCNGSVCSGNNTATDTDTIIGPSSSAPNVLLVKRITAINGDPSNNPNDNTSLDRVENLTTGPQANDDDHPHWPNSYLQGSIDGGRVKPGDRVDYNIYFLSAGDKNAAGVKICDRIPQNQTFVSTTFGADRGIQVEKGGQTLTYTNHVDGDASAFYPPGQNLPSFCGGDGSDPNSNPTGAIVVDLGTLPKSDSPVTPSGSYGFINFRAKVE